VIVADANLIAYYYLPGPLQARAQAILQKDPYWFVPAIMISEFRNILLGFIRAKKLHKNDALELIARVEIVFAPRTKSASSAQVIDMACASGCSAYDAEYAALAQMLGVKLVTNDKKLRDAFPGITQSLEVF
jgi:predicted nucleic acid-binding protein